MIATMHQTEHLPWLGFFHKLRQCEAAVLLDTVQFARRDFQNRNRIKGANGPIWLTVPVASKGSFEQDIEAVAIVNDRDWRRKCWSSMEHSYRRAPHFAEHRPFFEDLYGREWTRLVDLNVTIIRYLAGQLGIGTRLVLSSELGLRVAAAPRSRSPPVAPWARAPTCRAPSAASTWTRRGSPRTASRSATRTSGTPPTRSSSATSCRSSRPWTYSSTAGRGAAPSSTPRTPRRPRCRRPPRCRRTGVVMTKTCS